MFELNKRLIKFFPNGVVFSTNEQNFPERLLFQAVKAYSKKPAAAGFYFCEDNILLCEIHKRLVL